MSPYFPGGGSSGGSSGMATYPPLRVGNWGIPGMVFISTGGVNILPNNLLSYPFTLDTARNLDGVAFGVKTASAGGGLARVGIAAQGASLTSQVTLLNDLGTQAIDTIGVKTYTPSISLAAGNYMILLLTSLSCDMQQWAATNAMFGGMNRVDQDGYTNKRALEFPTAFGALPATYTPTFTVGWDPTPAPNVPVLLRFST